MILLWGLLEDPPMCMVYEELIDLDADIFFLDHKEVFTADIEFKYGDTVDEAWLHAGGRTLDLNRVTAVYARPYDYRQYDEMQDKAADDSLAVRASGFEGQLQSWIDSSEALVVNRSEASASNGSKPYQLALIRKAGFHIPETFITNEPESAQMFLQKNPDSVFKSISSVRSIVHKVSDAHIKDLNDVEWCPTLFQKTVPGHNYRVHVLGSQIFAVRIESDALDYRYGNTRMEAVELPHDIAEKCRKITSGLGLHFSGIDLMRTPDDEWYCFEVNPSPGYSYFQNESGVPISKALARFLMKG
ncbi:MAG TPA: ATP-grasp domain-containing protein [Candidatus Kapabacteria bacterium]|nr:ATP-grasp domain-containing protein [Candidatus Kapabacteria bacterium]